jgi:tetratricopeptide (TPR) repeat protein
VWQEFLANAADPRLAFLSVAVDARPERVEAWAKPYQFTTVVDSANTFGRLFDFDVVPNGILLDETGIIRHRHIGGFDIRRPEVAAQVTALLETDYRIDALPALTRQEPLDIEFLRTAIIERPDDGDLHFALGDALQRDGNLNDAAQAFRRAADLNPADWSAPFALGMTLARQGQAAESLAWWRQALARDPGNFIIRKQIWLAENPERFGDAIDFAWQKEQLAREGYA